MTTSQNIQIPLLQIDLNFPAESDVIDNEIRRQMNFSSSSTNHLFFLFKWCITLLFGS